MAASYLAGQGLRIEAHNVRVGGGELDLVADEAGTLVVVEVRARRGDWMPPAASVDAGKQRRVIAAARALLAVPAFRGRPVRFDVVAVTFPSPSSTARPATIEWIPAAFELPVSLGTPRRRRGWASLASEYLPPDGAARPE